MTKRLCSLILAFLLCASLCAAGEGDVSEMAAAAGLTVTASDNPDGALLCDYVVESSRKASVSWSDREQIYTVTGDAEAVSQLYVDAVSQGSWESCRYIVGRKARVSFAADSRLVCDTLEDYLHGSMYRLAMMLNTLFCLIIALAGIGSVLKIVFWG